MDSRPHSQRHRSRGRGSRAFSPAQYVQQHLPPPPQPPPYHASALQHRLSLVEDHFAGIPLEHCDYASILAYRQRFNGLLSSHPAGMVSQVARNQNTVWSQERLQGFHNAENRLAPSNDYNRQGGAFGRDYRLSRDDLRSLSELDNSRRSAALSAKLFLDDARPGPSAFQRDTPFESALPVQELSRHRIERQDISRDLAVAKPSQRTPRKRNREEDPDMDRDRAARHRRFHDPGLAVLPRTPQASQDFPFVQRMLSSGHLVESEDRQDSHTISNRPPSSDERLHISPAKSTKKKHLTQCRKISPSDMRHLSPVNASCSVKRLDVAKEKSIGLKDPAEIHLRTRDNKLSSSSPSASYLKKDTDAGFADDNRLNRLDNTEPFKQHRNSSAARATTKGMLDKNKEAGAQNSKQRLVTKSLSSIRKALRAVEATPRSKNLKTRVIRLLGSDAKVCGSSPKNRQGGQEDKGEVASEPGTVKGLATSSSKQAMSEDKRSSWQKDGKGTLCGVKIKQEQFAFTDVQNKCISPQEPSPELPVSSHMQLELTADCRIKALVENNVPTSVNLHQHGLEKQQSLVSPEVLLLHSRQEEVGTPRCHTATENPDWSIIDITGIATQPSTRLVSQSHELTLREQNSAPSLQNSNEGTDTEDMTRRKVKDQMSATLNNSLVSFNSQPLEQVLPTSPDCCPASTSFYDSHCIQSPHSPCSSKTDRLSHPSLFHTPNLDLPVSVMLKLAGDTCIENRPALTEAQKVLSGTEVAVTDPKETIAECEVRLFGKSLKAPVTKVSLGNTCSLMSLDLSLDRILKPVLPTLQLSCEQQGTPAGVCNMALGAEVNVPAASILSAVISEGEAPVDGLVKKGEEVTPVPPPNNTIRSPALPTSEPGFEKQGNEPSLPNKLSEAAQCVLHGMISEPSFSSPILTSEQQVGATELQKQVAEAISDAMIIPVIASRQQGHILGSQATHIDIMESVITSDMVSEQQAQTEAREGFPTKEPAPEEESCHAEAAPKHGGKQETFSSDKPPNYTPSKQISVAALQPHGRLKNVPGRAVANTWRRSSNTHGLSTSQVMPKVPKLYVNKHLPKVINPKVAEAAAYVRKGNSLVRASIPAITGVSSSSNTAVIGVGKDLLGKGLTAPRGYPGLKSAVNSAKSAFRQVFSVQKLLPNEATAKTSGHDKLLAANLEVSQDGQNIGSSQVGVKASTVATVEGQPHGSFSAKNVGSDEMISHLAGSETSNLEPSSAVQPRPLLPCVQPASAGLKVSEISSTFYVKSKANQLIAALPTKTPQVASSHSGPTDFYYKRNNNQLVRNGSDTKQQVLQDQKSRGVTHAVCHSTIRKAFKKRAYLPLSRVWTLKDGSSSQVQSVLPLLFPWKRTGLGVAYCAGRFKALPKAKKGSLLFFISKKLQRLRKVQPVYSRSALGFSLHRSGLLSLSGANLKWTKSIEKRSKQASEEATKAVAEVEKQRRKEKAAAAVAEAKVHRRMPREGSRGRERVVTIGLARYKMDPLGRTLQRLPDQWCGTAEPSLLKRSTELAILSTPRRLSFDGTEYVRIGNGHQLVRDPKAASRALANEKVRWSLHTVRSRCAKRQQYCLFFTRFGKCNKSEGDCPYIHDPEKIAVCTKFLKGTCLETNCLFSHKVIPERMPDCSFFLEGMCTNEKCPYRHVSVNPKAPICEGFLKGFCSDGDECNKKHTTVCPTFSATGECPDKSTCKLHHPKRSVKRVSNGNLCKHKVKKRKRYFGSVNIKSNQEAKEICLDKECTSFSTDSSSMEFIEIPDVVSDLDENDDFKRKLAFIKERLPGFQDGFHEGADMLIKPVFLLQSAIST